MFDYSCFDPAKTCFNCKLMFKNSTPCRYLVEIAVTTWKREERETPLIQTFKPRKVAGVARFLLQNYIPGTRFSGHDPFGGFGINCSWLQIMIAASALLLHTQAKYCANLLRALSFSPAFCHGVALRPLSTMGSVPSLSRNITACQSSTQLE